MHLSMIIWLYVVPFRYRRQMKKKDIDYQQRFKLQNILMKQSSSSPPPSTHENDQLQKTNINDRTAYL